MPHYLTAEGRAVKRFAVEGNAIRMLMSSRVQLPALPKARVAQVADLSCSQ